MWAMRTQVFDGGPPGQLIDFDALRLGRRVFHAIVIADLTPS